MGRLALTGTAGAGRQEAAGWTSLSITRIEDLSDAVLGAGLEAMQMSRAPVTGSLAFAMHDGVVYSSGAIGGRVALRGPLSSSQLTIGIGLTIASGSRHWLSEVATGDCGIFLPGDDHDAFYAPGSLYATATLSAERLDELAEQAGLVLDPRVLGGTGIYAQRLPERTLAGLRSAFERVHAGRAAEASKAARVGTRLLDAIVAQFGRPPRPRIGVSDPRGLGRIVARARAYALENLERPITVEAMVAAASTSRRTLHRAFNAVLDETPQSYVRKVRLHRIRRELATSAEVACTVSIAANRWGVSELGRLSGWYRDLFGELPSKTLRQARGPFEAAWNVPRLAQSAQSGQGRAT
jgi:AraC-like DNA-binding protein